MAYFWLKLKKYSSILIKIAVAPYMGAWLNILVINIFNLIIAPMGA